MKNFLLLKCILLLNTINLLAQSPDHNYVKKTTPLQPVQYGVSSRRTSIEELMKHSKKIENVDYYDGFGKVKQKVGVKGTSSKKDIIQHIEYDQFGRISRQYLPLPSSQNSGNFLSSSLTDVSLYYQSNLNDQSPYSETHFDDSPLNRKLEVSAPGDTWQLNFNSDSDHTVKYNYATNGIDEVYLISVNGSNTGEPIEINGYYADNELFKNIIKNENWKTSDGLLNTKEVFTDKGGKKIAEFSYEYVDGNKIKLSTYYIYDDFGNLIYILPPKLFSKLLAGVDYSDYNVSWQISDFVGPTGYSGSIGLTINNNILHITTFQDITNLPPHSPLYILNTYSTKNLNTSSVIPDMYLGDIMAANNNMLLMKVGEASIVNGNLVLEQTSSNQFKYLSLYVNLDLNSNMIISESLLDDLAFQYKYDEYNRQIQQKVPGKGWEYMIYDQLDRPILTQDSNLKAESKWLFNKYDQLGRIVISGKYSSSLSRQALQDQVDNHINSSSNKSNSVHRNPNGTENIGNAIVSYRNNMAFPDNNLETLSVNYYDNYSFFDPDLPYIPQQILGQEITGYAKGKLTATWSKVLTTEIWAWNKNYYGFDDRGRMIYNLNKNYLGGYTENKTKLGFRGDIEYSITNHKRKDDPFTSPLPNNLEKADISIRDRFQYDHAGRLLKHYQQVEDQEEELINQKDYNELDQLKSKNIGGNAGYDVSDAYTDVTNVDIEGGIIKSGINSSSWQAGLATVAEIINNGYVEYEIGQSNKSVVVGLSYNNMGTNYNTIDFGILTDVGGSLAVYESGNLINGLNTTYDSGDILKIERIGSTLKYKKNNELFYTSSISSSGKLIGDISMNHPEAIIKNFKISSDFKDIENLTISYNSEEIKKDLGGSSWNAGLATVKYINSNEDGYFSYKVGQTDKFMMIGLSDSNVNLNYNTIDFAIYNTNGVFYVYENGVSKGQYGSYEVNDEFTVERKASVINYKKNGEIFYTSVVSSNSKLYGDMSFYHERGSIYGVEINNLEKGLQTIDFNYNIRGWLTNYNNDYNLGSDLFAYQLIYDFGVEGTGYVENTYNGNIKQVIWNSALNSQRKSYSYEYDHLNRFKISKFRTGANLDYGAGKYETYNLEYDTNGNIKQLYRNDGQYGFAMDMLNYHYDDGNRLTSIRDHTNNPEGFNDGHFYAHGSTGPILPDYEYDDNGNLIIDRNKGIIQISYNHLDLVDLVEFESGHKIKFLYDATGTKLQMKTYLPNGTSTSTDYLNGFQYTNAELQFFPTPEGYVAKDNGEYKYVYTLNDHLGNKRVSFSDEDDDGIIDPSSEVLSNTDYYVMGLIHSGEYIAGIGSNHNYKYQNKEKLAFNGYDMYDFGSRMYDPAVGRWFNTDPQNQFSSPYLAMGNNHVMSIDPNGELAWFVPIIAGAVIGAGTTAIANPNASTNQILKGAAIGAISGAVTSGIGGAMSSMSTNMAITGASQAAINTATTITSAVAHGFFQGTLSATVGQGNFLQGASTGVISSLTGSLTSNLNPAIQIGVSGLTGGATSSIAGGNFIEGFATGTIVSGLNHAMHKISQINQSGGPPYEYNGELYKDETSLYFAILIDQAAGQFGIKDIIALTAAIDNQGLLSKSFQSPGASKGTSYASKYGAKLLPGEMPMRLPTHIRNGIPRYTKVFGRFLGRMAGPVGWAILSYDVGMTFYKTQTIYNKLTSQ